MNLPFPPVAPVVVLVNLRRSLSGRTKNVVLSQNPRCPELEWITPPTSSRFELGTCVSTILGNLDRAFSPSENSTDRFARRSASPTLGMSSPEGQIRTR